MELKKICVYCGTGAGTDPNHLIMAQRLGRTLAKKGIGLVYGGGNVGLMGSVADAVLAAGGHVTGVMTELLVSREIAHKNVSELHIVGSMHERKALMSELSSAFIALSGGIGTLEEIMEVATWQQLGIQLKPCGFLNVSGFYDHFCEFLNSMVSQGFFSQAHRDQLVFTSDIDVLMARLEAYVPRFIPKQYQH